MIRNWIPFRRRTNNASLDRIEHELAVIRQILDDQRKWQRLVQLRLASLVRSAAIADEDLPYPFSVLSRRFSLHSQNEEDGITWALLKEIGMAARRFVEIGSGSTGGNSAFLAADFGWGGLMIEADAERAAIAKEKFQLNPAVVVANELVTPDNINDILRNHGFTGEVDLVSLDIDGDDYWVWEAMDVCRPRLFIAEYNAWFGPRRAVTVPKDSRSQYGAIKGYHGASLAALAGLGRRKGYRLTLCAPGGINAFFIRQELAPHIPALEPQMAFQPQLRRKNPAEDEVKDRDIYALCARHNLPLVEV